MLSTFLYAIGKGFGNYRRQSIHLRYRIDRRFWVRERSNIDDLAYNFISSERARLAAFIRQSLYRTYGGTTSHLVRWGTEKFAATLTLRHMTISISFSSAGSEFSVLCRMRPKAQLLIALNELNSIKKLKELEVQHKGEHLRRQIRFELIEPNLGRYSLTRDLSEFLIAGAEGTVLWNPSYLLAERAGLVRIYRPLLAAYMRASLPTLVQAQRQHHVPLTKLLQELGSSSLQLPILASDFLEDFLLTGRAPPSSWPARQKAIERTRQLILVEIAEIMEGEITVSENLEMMYRQKDRQIDIGLASSMVAEIAPMYHILKSGSVESLVIEEPEAHLHVAKQYRFARVLSYLLSMGVGTFITTHSITLPIALAHMTALPKLSVATVAGLGFNSNMAISPGKLGVLWLRKDEGGNVIEEIRISATGSIERLPEADDILQHLYQEEERIATSIDSN